MIRNTFPNKSENSKTLKSFPTNMYKFGKDLLRVVLLTVLYFKWSVKAHYAAKYFLAVWDYFYLKIIVAVIPTNLDTHLLVFTLFRFFIEFKIKNRFSAGWFSGNKK